MTSRKVFLLTICSLVLLAQITPVQSWSCCLKVTKRPLHCKRLLTYSFQSIHQNCDIDAYVFLQTNERFVCAHPDSQYTRRAIKCIDQRRQKEEEAKRG